MSNICKKDKICDLQIIKRPIFEMSFGGILYHVKQVAVDIYSTIKQKSFLWNELANVAYQHKQRCSFSQKPNGSFLRILSFFFPFIIANFVRIKKVMCFGAIW